MLFSSCTVNISASVTATEMSTTLLVNDKNDDDLNYTSSELQQVVKVDTSFCTFLFYSIIQQKLIATNSKTPATLV